MVQLRSLGFGCYALISGHPGGLTPEIYGGIARDLLTCVYDLFYANRFQIMLPGGGTLVAFCGRILALGVELEFAQCLGANGRGFPGVNPPGWPLISALLSCICRVLRQAGKSTNSFAVIETMPCGFYNTLLFISPSYSQKTLW